MKKFVISLAVMGMLFCSNLGASAEQKIGFVDMSKILSSCTKAQEISSDIRVQQEEIQKMIADARNQVNAAKTDKEREDLEKKLTGEIQQKNNLFKADYEKNVQALQDNIVSSVKKVSENKKIDFIFKKDNIIIGGQDITDDVLAQLNK
jgi:outer membrane protein